MASKIESGQVKMRVYQLPADETLREAIGRTRDKREQTLEEFLAEAVAAELPELAKALLAMGIEKAAKTRPVRWPMRTKSLQKLAYASEQTGIPQQQLLLAACHLSCQRKRRRRAR